MATTERAALQAAQQELAAQPRARKELIETFWAGALLDAVEESKASDSVDGLRHWTEVSGAVLSLLRGSDPAVLNRVLEALEGGDPAEPDTETLEAWGRVQVHATLGRVREASHTVHWLHKHGVSRQRLEQWRRARTGGRDRRPAGREGLRLPALAVHRRAAAEGGCPPCSPPPRTPAWTRSRYTAS